MESLINWPGDLSILKEGGMYVYAVVPAEGDEDAFIGYCGLESCYLMWGEIMLEEGDHTGPSLSEQEESIGPEERFWFPHLEEGGEDPKLSRPLLAAVWLGSSKQAHWNQELGRYWVCSPEDLTPSGQEVFEKLTAIYGKEPKLLTFLDS